MSASVGDESESDAEPAEPGRPGRGLRPPTVLIADGPKRAARYGEFLPDPFPVRTASTPADVREETSDAVGVGIYGPGVDEDTKSELLELLHVRSPFARAIVIQGEDGPPMLEGAGYDVCMFTPVDGEDLREAVARLARIGTYERAVSTYFEYTTHATSMQVGRDEAALEADDTYQELQERIERTQVALERIRATLDEADRRVLVESIETDPTGGFGGESASAGGRHPDACNECRLDWGHHHGGGLGEGFEQLGAFVWKCTRCGNVQQAASASHRWLARR